MISILVVGLLLVAQSVASNNAFVSILSTNDYLLAAKVLAYSIKVQNMKEPYVIFYTENVATQSLKSLRSLGIYTFPITKIDTPYRASHEATKFQYTRINLWAMTNYTTLVSLDLDTLVKHDISALFRCGSFCASMRHSDKFNAGVMVLKPNKTVFDDMSKKYSILPSYDGGDQGFMNSYFANTKYASMFNPDDMNWPNESNSIHTLSMAYNYDVGAYYLQSRLLIEPKIIHYTMGPTKPWIWWTYPMFDLNWEWYRLRVEVERLDGDSSEGLRVFFTESLIALFLLLLYKILANYVKGPSRWRAKDSFIAYFLLQLCALAFSFLTVPSQKCLLTSWTIFIANQLLFLLFLSALYIRIVHDTTPNFTRILQFIFFLPTTATAIWFTLKAISAFSDRCIVMLILLPAWILFANCLCRRLSAIDNTALIRHEPVKTS
uniref:glycogenin glucosyltransferase n=1 Tax=Parascaris univalens TaxID=6257 RepID=A0A915C9S9_PARUN